MFPPFLQVQNASEPTFFFTTILLIFIAPYTKVEESFSLHAIRDILSFGTDKTVLHLYDHNTFPGAVPRSFIGPLLLSAVTKPLLLWKQRPDGAAAQFLVRFALGLLSTTSVIFLSRRARTAFGPAVAYYSLLITSTQFHLMFWISRTLPNMFAFPLVQIALGLLLAPSSSFRTRTKRVNPLKSEVLLGFALLTFAAIVFRLELIALTGPLALEALLRKTVGFCELVLVGIAAAGASLAITVGVDSYFWGYTVWPEGAGFLFNVVEGNSVQWGTSPWYTYFLLSLPKLLNFSYPLAIAAMLIDRRCRRIGYPSLAFVALLSLLKHKEWRFIVYVIPVLNTCAAAGLKSLEQLYSKRVKRTFVWLIITTNLSLAAVALYASRLNYPGGVALEVLSSHLLSSAPSSAPLSIHIDSPTAMSGASRFLHPFENPTTQWYITPSPSHLPSITYDRSETLKLEEYDQFDYLLTGEPGKHLERGGWKEVERVKGFAGFEKGGRVGLRTKRVDRVWVLKREV